ncbi:MAG: 2-phosphosulfolactate phosphatase [Ignavibacteriales bacterium]|nr:2-phosphosulfolactate phosphatase [Ignavibacteriales bacterium]
MKVNVLFSNNNYDELYFTGKTCVVIDVLRASTVIVTALANGAREVIPVSTVDFAMKVSGDAFRSQTLLGGERNTKKVEGFTLGNSPLEYIPEVVNGKSIIHYTTNGSKAIVKAKFSENLFVGCFNNASAVVQHCIGLKKDLEIVCAGNSGAFNLEDAICAGLMISEIVEKKKDAVLTDSAGACVLLHKTYVKNILKMLKNTEHGKLLAKNGFDEDIKECAKIDSTDIIPYFNSGVIKKIEK